MCLVVQVSTLFVVSYSVPISSMNRDTYTCTIMFDIKVRAIAKAIAKAK